MKTLTQIASARAAGDVRLTEAAGKALLQEYGIAVPSGVVVPVGESPMGESSLGVSVQEYIGGLRPPLVVKAVARDLVHKSDAGGVAVGLTSVEAAQTAINAMLAQPGIANAGLSGFLVEEMAPGGHEIVVGGVVDPQFGPMIMIGLGGIFIEVLKDVSFAICPINESEALCMIDQLKGVAILDGARGGVKVSRAGIARVLVALGGEDGLFTRHSADIAEVDVNPLIVGNSGAVAVDARFILATVDGKASANVSANENTDNPCTAVTAGDGQLTIEDQFRPLFEPATIAVVGASTTSSTMANTFIRRMKSFGYPGEIYPIHPKAAEVESLPAFPTLAETPRPIDYAYIAIGAQRIPDVVASANGNVRFAQVISSGFREVESGRSLEDDLLRSARAAGCRIVGPNCLGLYSPRGGVTFPVDAPREVGTVGVVTQSGGLGTDVVKRGQWRGLRFSGLVTAGNSADIGPADLVEYYLADEKTKAIGLYLEDGTGGRRLFELLRAARPGKPVVILKGGRSQLGQLAAQSHTGALAGDERAWQALSMQTPVALVNDVDDFLGTLLLLQNLGVRTQRPTRNVVLFGNGGGTSVLATDAFSERGLRITPFDAAAREPLEALNLPPGTSVVNPIDAPVRTLQEDEGRIANRILDIIYNFEKPDAVVMHLNLASFVGRGDVDPIDNLIDAAVNIQNKYPGQAHFVLVLRSDGSQALDDNRRKYRERALSIGIPVFDELAEVANAMAGLAHLERQLATVGDD